MRFLLSCISFNPTSHLNWSVFIVWLPLVLEILGNLCIAIVCFPGCDVNLNRFSTWPRSQDKYLNILRTKRAFKVKQKAFFIIFKGLSIAKNCLRPESAPLIQALLKKLKKWFSVSIKNQDLILYYCWLMPILLGHLSKNTWKFSSTLIRSLKTI